MAPRACVRPERRARACVRAACVSERECAVERRCSYTDISMREEEEEEVEVEVCGERILYVFACVERRARERRAWPCCCVDVGASV